jgi:hypothetical protein
MDDGRKQGPKRRPTRQPVERDDPGGRSKWFREKRGLDEKDTPPDLIRKASEKKHELEAEEKRRQQEESAKPPEKGDGDGPNDDEEAPAPPGGAGSVNWTPLGPSVIARGQATGRPPCTGQIRALAVGPGGTRVYAGAANGGVWFTSDGGARWAPLDDFVVSPTLTAGRPADSLSVGALGVRFGATAATDLVYVGTGEPTGGDAYFGIGIRRSASGGSPGSWTLEATHLAAATIYKVVIDPDDPAVVLAATSLGLFRRPAAGPFTTWTQVTDPDFVNPAARATDLVVAGSGASKRYYAVFSGGAAYRSPDGANGNWTPLTGIAAGSGRVGLAVGESDPSIAYALSQNGTLYRLVGTAFEVVAGSPPVFLGGQGSYDLILGVDPSNSNVVYAGGDIAWDPTGPDWNLAFFRGTITGSSGSFSFGFTNTANPYQDATWIGRGVHADAHALAFARNAGNTGFDATNVWVGCDGGIWQSTTSGSAASFRPRNTGLAVAEVGYFAQRLDTDAAMFGGLQDNGTIRYWGEPAVFESPRGDGGGVAVDPNDQYRVMRQYVRAGSWVGATLAQFSAGLSTCTDGGASGSWSAVNFPPLPASPTNQQKTFANTENGSTAFYTRIATTPSGVSPTMVGFGTNRLWVTSDWGATWVTLPTNTNPYTTAATAAAPLGQDQLGASVVDVAFASGTRIFAATSAQVFRFDLSGGTWTRTGITTTGLPVPPRITSIGVENAATGTFYVSLGGSARDHVYYFDGTSWQSAGGTTLTQAVVDVTAEAVVVDPDNPQTLYAGTDVGCWKGVKSGAPPTWAWVPFSQGLPESAITQLSVHRRTRLLRASLHGRGLWEIQMDAPTSADTELYLRVNSADTGRISGTQRFTWVEGAQDPRRRGFNVHHWMSPDIKVRRPSIPNPNTISTPPDYLDFAVNIADYVDSGNTETADRTGVNRLFIQVHNRGRLPVPASQVRVLLLVTDAAAGLPALPAGYTNRINTGDTTNWVAGSQWRFADPMSPYRSPVIDVDARNPGVVFYDFDFSTMALPAGHNHVCAAAFVTTTTAADRLTGTTASMDQLTMTDRHAAHRNLHLVAAGDMPIAPGGETDEISPQTVLIDFHNVSEDDSAFEIHFERRESPLRLALFLSGRHELREQEGWKIGPREEVDERLDAHIRRWASDYVSGCGPDERVEFDDIPAHLKRRLAADDLDEREARALRRFASIDYGQAYVPSEEEGESRLSEVRIPAGSSVTAAMTLQPPEGAKPGDTIWFDVVQRAGKTIVGGSTYRLVVPGK